MSECACRSGRGASVSEVARGGAAEPDDRLTRGDHIPSVNDKDAANATQEAVAAILKVTRAVSGGGRDLTRPALSRRTGSRSRCQKGPFKNKNKLKKTLARN